MIIDKEKAFKKLAESRNGIVFRNFAPHLKDDEDVAMAAIEKWGGNVMHASERLRNDPFIMSAAIYQTHYAFKYMGGALLADKQFLLQHRDVFHRVEDCYRDFAPEIRNDRDFATAFISLNGLAFKHLPREFKRDKFFAHLALETNPDSFSQVKQYHTDDETIKIALRENSNYRHLPLNLREEKSWILYMLHDEYGYPLGNSELEYMGENLKNDKDLFKILINENHNLFFHADNTLKCDLELTRLFLDKVSEPMCDTDNVFDLWESVILKSFYYLTYAPQEFRNDRKFILKALEEDLQYIEYASEEIKNMLGENKYEYIERLEEIIKIEELSITLDKSLDKKTNDIQKNKI